MTILLGLIVSLRNKNAIGVTIAVPFLHYGMALFAFIRALRTTASLSKTEMIIFFLSYGV